MKSNKSNKLSSKLLSMLVMGALTGNALAEHSKDSRNDQSQEEISQNEEDRHTEDVPVEVSHSSALSKTIADVEEPKHIQQKPTESILLKLKWVKNAGQAVLAANKLRRSAVLLGEAFFEDHGVSFREGKSYLEEYAVKEITEEQEISRLQSEQVFNLKNEIEVIEEDLNAFLASEKMNEVIKIFIEQNKLMFENFKTMKESAGYMLDALVGMVIPEGVNSESMIGDLHSYLDSTYSNFNSKSEDAQQSLYASMYLVASIFHNNKTKMAYLFDNENVIKHVGEYIKNNIGESPLLSFAVEVAPSIDIVNRQLGGWDLLSAKNFLVKYRWPIVAVVAVAGIGLISYPYFVGGKKPNQANSGSGPDAMPQT